MVEGYLYCRREAATAAQLLSQMAALTDDWNRPAYRYQERLDDVELDYADVAWAEQLAAGAATLWPAGRVFCPAGEVRWEAIESGYAVQVIAENDLALPEAQWDRTTFERVETEQRLYLWGERKRKDKAWIETRIPRPLRYPAPWSQKQKMVAVRGKTYRQNGITKLTRLIWVEALPNPMGKEVER
jgi:hypothetical protein